MSLQPHDFVYRRHIKTLADNGSQAFKRRFQIVSSANFTVRGKTALYPQTVDKPAAEFIGIENAVRYWKTLLKQGGHIMISDIFWFTRAPSDEARDFFAEYHPAMMTEEEVFGVIRDAGLELVEAFRLPSRVWEESFYGELRKRFGALEEKFADDEVALMVINGLKRQTEIFDKYQEEFGNTYCIMRKPL